VHRRGVGPLTADDLFGPDRAAHTEFAHNSESEFARLLDFYAIDWEYEPTAFAIDWDDDGEPVSFFRPDFYLPDDDVYIEITTMNQKLVTKKNRKVRMLREAHPDIRCKIFYQRD
jgi:hypoxanthine phosphoribosyltransferase